MKVVKLKSLDINSNTYNISFNKDELIQVDRILESEITVTVRRRTRW